MKKDRICQRKKIIKRIKDTNNWDMLDKIENIIGEEDKVYITDFITEMFKKNYPLGTCEYTDHYHDPVIIDAFEEDIRRIYLKISNKLIPSSNYINHWCDLYVKTRGHELELDLWISEQGYLFNTSELCWVIFNIWCDKITFEK